MAKKKISKTNAIRKLEQNKVTFTQHEYPWNENHLDAKTAAKNGDFPLEKIYKTLVASGNATGPIVVCIPSRKEIDLKALAKVSKNKRVELLPVQDLEQTTGYVRGGTSPIGMKKQYPTYIAATAEGLPTVIVSAGKRGMQIELDPHDLQRMTQAVFADVCET